jgi:hypothetical protein
LEECSAHDVFDDRVLSRRGNANSNNTAATIVVAASNPAFFRVGGMRSSDLRFRATRFPSTGYQIMLSQQLAALFVRDLTRLTQELRAFPDTPAVWQTAPGVTNAAGTLALHLEGNLREYVGRLLGGIDYRRDRPLEFTARNVDQADLIARIEATRELVARVISSLSDETLGATYPVPYDGLSLSTDQFLINLLAHLNYHLGQVDYLRRFTTGSGAISLASLSQ